MNSGTMNTRSAETFRQNLFHLRFLFPKRLAHVSEDLSPTQFRCVLMNRRGGIFVLRRAVAQQHQRSISEILVIHARWLADGGSRCKLGCTAHPIRPRRGWFLVGQPMKSNCLTEEKAYEFTCLPPIRC